MRKLLYILITLVCFCSCYQERTDDLPARHYGIGYNFEVRADSLVLIAQQPEEHISQMPQISSTSGLAQEHVTPLTIDSFSVAHGSHIAILDMHVLPQDSIDSVWVKLIGEQGQYGWIHETEMLRGVVPTDPISQFIMFFSDTHVVFALIALALIIATYAIRKVMRKGVPLVHFHDIPSFYPTLLCITVAAAATFYASLQMFGADTWQQFYYHPSLNPFLMPPILGIFVSSVWAMLIIGLAAAEDTRHHLSAEDAIVYLAGLGGTCALLYIIFSITTLYYIGYPLLAAYCWFAVRRYWTHSRQHYICGNCGKRLHAKGLCPHCGAINE